jgi:hypothetical protein
MEIITEKMLVRTCNLYPECELHRNKPIGAEDSIYRVIVLSVDEDLHATTEMDYKTNCAITDLLYVFTKICMPCGDGGQGEELTSEGYGPAAFRQRSDVASRFSTRSRGGIERRSM